MDNGGGARFAASLPPECGFWGALIKIFKKNLIYCAPDMYIDNIGYNLSEGFAEGVCDVVNAAP